MALIAQIALGVIIGGLTIALLVTGFLVWNRLYGLFIAGAAEFPIMTLFSFGLSNAPVFEHALLTQLALVASWVSARDVPGLRKLIAYRAARPIRWIMTHLLLPPGR